MGVVLQHGTLPSRRQRLVQPRGFPAGIPSGFATARVALFAALAAAVGFAADAPAPEIEADPPTPDAAEQPEVLSLPGLKINLEEKSVDVDAEFCLQAGLLELVACKKDSKEHESIVSIEAKAAHIHAALLLLGAEAGNPAMRKPVGEDPVRWIDLPPRGQPVDVSLVFADKSGKAAEHPIQNFMVRATDYDYSDPEPDADAKPEHFSTSTFVFAGSLFYAEGEGPPRYLADESGNVISISTFGDELLCLPGLYSHDAGALVWEIDSSRLPPPGTKALLRLRPKFANPEEPAEEPTGEPTGEPAGEPAGEPTENPPSEP